MAFLGIIHAVVKQAGAITSPAIPPSDIMIPTSILLGAALAAGLMFCVTPLAKRWRAAISAGIVGAALGGIVYGILREKVPGLARMDGAVLGTAFVTGTLLTKIYLLALDQLPQVAIDAAKDTLRAAAARISKTSAPTTDQGSESNS